MNISTKKTIFFLFVLGFLIFLGSLNSLMGTTQEQSLKEIQLPSLESNSPVHFYVSLQYGEDLFQTVTNSSWDYAFCESDYPNPDKRVELIFHSQEVTYGVPCGVSTLEHKESNYPQIDQYNDFNGISTTFSTANMKNGVYQLYLYVYENQHNFGLVDTEMEYVKHYDSFSRLIEFDDFLAQEQDLT